MKKINFVGKDIKRIDKILKLVKKLWKMCPEQRLLQLLINISLPSDSFYIEDSYLEQKLKDHIAIGKGIKK
jgi:uncharacterized protein YihD (DUF1040 family)